MYNLLPDAFNFRETLVVRDPISALGMIVRVKINLLLDN